MELGDYKKETEILYMREREERTVMEGPGSMESSCREVKIESE